MAVLPTTDISTTLVRNTLGEDNNNVGLLCTSGKINMFSKYKPITSIRVGGVDTSSDTAIRIYELTTRNEVKNWAYAKPTSSYPKRLGDFRNYWHEAPAPLLQNVGKTLTVNPFFGQIYAIGFNIPTKPTGMTSYCLDVEDLHVHEVSTPLNNNYHLAAALYNSNNALVATFAATDNLSYTNSSTPEKHTISLEQAGNRIKDIGKGTYKLYLQIGDAFILPVGQSVKYYSIYGNESYPNVIDVTITGVDSVFSAEVLGIRPYGGGGTWADGIGNDYKIGNIPAEKTGFLYAFDVKVKIKNISTQDATIPKNNLYLYYNRLTDWEGGNENRYLLYSTDTSSLSLAAGASTEIIFQNMIIAPTYRPIVNVEIEHAAPTSVTYKSGTAAETLAGTLPNIKLNYVGK